MMLSPLARRGEDVATASAGGRTAPVPAPSTGLCGGWDCEGVEGGARARSCESGSSFSLSSSSLSLEDELDDEDEEDELLDEELDDEEALRRATACTLGFLFVTVLETSPFAVFNVRVNYS